MKSILIHNARIIDPSQNMDETASLSIRDGKVAWIGSSDQKPPGNNSSVIEAENLILCP
jgi:dihydroorotase-like cyclic amidohydrolase